MSDINADTEAMMRGAKAEENIVPEMPWNKVFFFTLKATPTTTSFTIAQTMNELLKDDLAGLSKLDLVKLCVRYKMTAEDQTISAGVWNSGATIDAMTAAGMPGGFSVTSNKYSYGKLETVEIIPPGIYSRQIQPTSSHLPNFKFYLEANKNMMVWIHVYLKFHGPLLVHRDLKL